MLTDYNLQEWDRLIKINFKLVKNLTFVDQQDHMYFVHNKTRSKKKKELKTVGNGRSFDVFGSA